MKDEELETLLTGASGRPQPFEWREYYHAIRERLWMVLLCLVLGGIGAAIYMSRQETRYQARAVLFLEQEQNRVLKDVKAVSEDRIVSVDMINTVADLLRGYPFALRVVENQKLHEDSRWVAALPGNLFRKQTSSEAAWMLSSKVSAQWRKNTRLIDIFVTHRDAALATALASAYADEYMRYIFENRTIANKGATQYLFDEGERLRKKMRVSDEAMQSFRERERAASLENLQESAQMRLSELSRSVADLEQKIFQLETDLKVVRSAPNDPDELLRLPSVATEPKVARLTEAVADSDRLILLLSQRYRAKHPAYISAQTQRDSLVTERATVLQNVVSLLEAGRVRLQGQLDEVKKISGEQEDRLLSVSGKFVEYNDLKRDLQTDQAMYDSVLARIKEIDLTKGLTDAPLRIHERAIGATPIRVSLTKTYSAGLFLGLAVGLGLALGLHSLDHTIKTVEQAEQATGLTVLAAVAAKKKVKGRAGAKLAERTLDAVTDRNGLIAESFRSLRASLAMLGDVENKRTFLFTSAVPSEGKTFCSANFAVTLSQQGLRTLLIDADLRKPTVSNVFFGESRKPGLGEVLAGQVPFGEAISTTEHENLSVLTAGGRAPNPAELLSTKAMRKLIEEAATTYDRVVIDTAPMLAVSDALLIAPHVHIICLVLRSFATPRKTVARAVKSLNDIHCRPAGLILNFVPSGSGSYYHYYYSGKYYGSYGEKGVYGAK